MVDDFPFQDEDWFIGFENKTINQYVSEIKSMYSEKEIADGFGLTIDDLRKELSKSFNAERYQDYIRAVELAAEGKGATEIGRILGKPEGSVRYMLKHHIGNRASASRRIADILIEEVNNKIMIDVGEGVELSSKFYGISRSTFDVALSICADEGYPSHVLTFPQRGAEAGKATKMRVLCLPGTTRKEAKKQIGITKTVDDYEVQLNRTDAGIPPIVSVDSRRIYVLYNEDGGILRDGEMLLRPGVPDLDLGLARYAQVRIAVDNVAYMKGVVLLSNKVPPGYDIVYCSNKHRGAPFLKVFKPFERNKFTGEVDWDNPFGATIKMEEKLRLVPRYWYDDEGRRFVSPINVVNEPGDWANWDKKLSPQYLSKQQLITVMLQLNLTIAEKRVKFEQLCALTNPAVRAKLLYDFAEKCDSDAVELKATPYPTQQYHLLVSFPDMPEDQCYAPNFKSGVMVACIRFPHAGPFELALLMVNNDYPEAVEMLENNAPDAIGINPVVAGKLSGADFDGDAVTVFQVGDGVSVKWEPQLEGLKDYEPKELYVGYEGMERLSKKATQTEMGLITNLIADMQIKGAPPELVVRAVRHSMTIIDAHKHFLDWKKSYEDNGIKELKIKYQGGVRAGASTLITRAGSKMSIPYRERAKHDDKATGKKLWNEKPKKFKSKKTGKEVEIKKKVDKMYYYDDAYELLSGGDREHSYPVEVVYADFANALKRLADLARKVSMECPKIVVSPTAKKTFKPQIDSLMAKLRQAKANSVRERQAMLRTNVKLWEKFKIIDEEVDACESEEERQRLLDLYDEKEKAKITQQYLATNRLRFGVNRDPIKFTPLEALAINSGALSHSVVMELIRYADPDDVRANFTPRPDDTLSESMIEYINGLNEEGWPTAEIAEMCGLPVSRVQKVFLEGC